MQEVERLPSWAGGYDISWVCTILMLHCQSSISTVDDDSLNLNEETKLLFVITICDTSYRENNKLLVDEKFFRH